MNKIGKRRTGGRNNKGRITIRHRGGGQKRLIRVLEKGEIGGRIERIEHDANRTGYVGVCVSEKPNGEVRRVYKLIGGDKGEKNWIGKEIRAERVKDIEVGGDIYKVSIRKGEEGKIARAAGAKCKVIKIEESEVIIRMPSGKVGSIKGENVCYRGEVAGEEKKRMEKAGDRRRLGERPRVRGVAMNAVDHPHGGKTPSGQARTLWGKLAKWIPTRNPRKISEIKRVI